MGPSRDDGSTYSLNEVLSMDKLQQGGGVVLRPWMRESAEDVAVVLMGPVSQTGVRWWESWWMGLGGFKGAWAEGWVGG